jgi:hypothetical protein
VINQREAVARGRRTRRPGVFWRPHGLRVAPSAGDIYLVVDELDDQKVVVVAARWPELDAAGRLRFEDKDPIAIPTTQETLEKTVRRPGGRRGLQRPLRIGDVFLVRRQRKETDAQLAAALTENDPASWGDFIDITRAAREAAKTALYAAAAPRVTDERAEELGLTKKALPEEPPPTATIAAPARNL